MSYQAHRYATDLRGLSRGEKTVLLVLACYHDHRTGWARVSQEQIAIDGEMTERHVIRMLNQLEARKIISRNRAHSGRGAITVFTLPGCERVTFETKKGDIQARKGDICDTHNKERKNKQVEARETSAGDCLKHPESGRTPWGTCWACYAEATDKRKPPSAVSA